MSRVRGFFIGRERMGIGGLSKGYEERESGILETS
jgi:hypothetical protein